MCVLHKICNKLGTKVVIYRGINELNELGSWYLIFILSLKKQKKTKSKEICRNLEHTRPKWKSWLLHWLSQPSLVCWRLKNKLLFFQINHTCLWLRSTWFEIFNLCICDFTIKIWFTKYWCIPYIIKYNSLGFYFYGVDKIFGTLTKAQCYIWSQ